MTPGVKEGRANVIAIGPDDTLLDVFDRVRAAGQESVELAIPNESSLFLTAAEFRTLRDVADHGRHAVTIRTPDPLRLQLAKLFGLEVALIAAPPARPAPKPAPVAAPVVDEARPTGGATAAGTATDGPRTNQSKQHATVTTAPDEPDADEPLSAISEAEAVAQWPAEPVAHRPVPGVPRRLRDRVSAAIATHRRPPAPALEPEVDAAEAASDPEVDATALPTGAADDESGDDTSERIHWVGDRRRVSPLVIIGVVLFIALVIVTAVNFLLPSAAVTLDLASVPINSELLFDVTASGQPLDDDAAFALPGTPATVTVVFEAMVPATGLEAIPDGLASGTVRLANPTPTEQTVAAGIILTTEAGAEFRIVEPVVVPAADPGTGAPGQAEGAIQAVDPGTTGNVATGQIGGRLPNGVFYSNRQGPTAGGSSRELQTVAQADLDELRQMADAGIVELVEAELQAGEAGAGGAPAVVAPTLTVLESEETFDQELGAEAESVSLRAERTVSVLTYDQAVAAARLARELGDQLQRTLPEGFQLGPVALGSEDVSVVEGTTEGARFQVNAAAQADLVLTDAKRAELAQQLAGKSEAEVATILDGMPEVSSFEIEPGFRLFSSSMPANAGRIEIDDGSER